MKGSNQTTRFYKILIDDEIPDELLRDEKYGGDVLKLYHIIKSGKEFRRQTIYFKNNEVDVVPGDFITSYRELSKRTGMNSDKIKRRLKIMMDKGMISVISEKAFTRIKVLDEPGRENHTPSNPLMKDDEEEIGNYNPTSVRHFQTPQTDYTGTNTEEIIPHNQTQSKKNSRMFSKKCNNSYRTNNKIDNNDIITRIIEYLQSKYDENYIDAFEVSRKTEPLVSRITELMMKENKTEKEIKQMIDKRFKHPGSPNDPWAYISPSTILRPL